MTIAADLLRRHIETLVDDNAQWQTLIADDLVWELAYGPSIGHPARLSGRDEVMRHLAWFLGAVEKFRFYDLIKPTGRTYRQDYVVFLRAAGGKIAFMREYFDPVRVAKATDTPIP